MPHKSYTHNCKKDQGKETTRGIEICPDCGEKGIFAGWELSMIEHMGAYQRRYNLRALGPHRALTHKLFDDRMEKCERCNGKGVIGVNNDETDELCPKCNFKGYLFNGTPQEFESIRQKIIAIYPTADPGNPLPKPSETSPADKGFVGGGFLKPGDLDSEEFKDRITDFLRAIIPDYKEDPNIPDEEGED